MRWMKGASDEELPLSLGGSVLGAKYLSEVDEPVTTAIDVDE
jgi:hypothetical protein